MKVFVIVIMALYSAITSADSYPKETYEWYKGKCTATSQDGRHPRQLLRNHRGCLYQQSKEAKVIIMQCNGWRKQIIQFTESNCKA